MAQFGYIISSRHPYWFSEKQGFLHLNVCYEVEQVLLGTLKIEAGIVSVSSPKTIKRPLKEDRKQ